MATGGSYRIQSTTINKEFPMPDSTSWDEQPIASGLNGIPVNTSYKIHTWDFTNMLGSDYDDLASLYDGQQSSNAQLNEMETDPYPADLSCNEYGTLVYTDFIIQNIAPRTRGLPFYDSVQVVFEVFVS
jgi:hypothetical protein